MPFSELHLRSAKVSTAPAGLRACRPVVLAGLWTPHWLFFPLGHAIYERDLIDQGALVLLEVNPNFPRTFGDTQVHISEVDAPCGVRPPYPPSPWCLGTEVDKNWRLVASLVEDGSTIQLIIRSATSQTPWQMS